MPLTEILNFTDIPNDTIVVFDCYATWCKPCHMIAPKFEEFSNTYKNMMFTKVNVEDEDKAHFVKKFEISAMPTFVFYLNGNVLHKVFGASEKELRAALEHFTSISQK